MSQSPLLDKENTHNRMPELTTPFRKTPLRQQHHNLPLTPPGSSKVLRRHFQQLSVTPQRTNLQSGAVRLPTPKRTNFQSGAVRLTPRVPIKTPKKKKTPPRIGYDGTNKTPSRELLRSTACSRSHRISKPRENDSHSIVTLEETILHDERQECCDPVALTLLNDGKEDLQLLLEQDVVESSHAIQKVSSRLLDVMDHAAVSTLVRPVPKMAR